MNNYSLLIIFIVIFTIGISIAILELAIADKIPMNFKSIKRQIKSLEHRPYKYHLFNSIIYFLSMGIIIYFVMFNITFSRDTKTIVAIYFSCFFFSLLLTFSLFEVVDALKKILKDRQAYKSGIKISRKNSFIQQH